MRRLPFAVVLAVAVGCSSAGFDVTQQGDSGDVDGSSGDSTADSPIDSSGETAPPIDTAGDTSGDIPDIAPPSCDPTEIPGEGIFVSVVAGADGEDGTQTAPLRTIKAAIGKALTGKKKRIFLDTGTYPERVNLDGADGVRIEGGFKLTAGVWHRNCGPSVVGDTIIASPENVAVTVRNSVLESEMRLLTIVTKPKGDTKPGAPGESLIAIVVRGSTTAFSLQNVVVEARVAGGGGLPGGGSSGGTICGGLADCSDGLAGAAGTPVSPPKTIGVFGPDGYVAANGPSGMSGFNGHNGTAGGGGASVSCLAACETGCPGTSGCLANSVSPKSSGAGKCGCGGGGGGGGGGGFGGGASIAVLVHGGAKVTTNHTILKAGFGGDGSAGGAATAPSGGTLGSVGASQTCSIACEVSAVDCKCVFSSAITVAGGAAGGKGGTGGVGADGAGGTGGPSFAMVLASGGTATTDFSALTFAKGGSGPSGAANGGEGDKLVQP